MNIFLYLHKKLFCYRRPIQSWNGHGHPAFSKYKIRNKIFAKTQCNINGCWFAWLTIKISSSRRNWQMIVKLGFVYVLEQRLAVTQEFKCFLTKKKYCSLLWSIIVEISFTNLLATICSSTQSSVIMSLILQPYFNLHWVLIYEKSGRDMPFKIKLRTSRI